MGKRGKGGSKRWVTRPSVPHVIRCKRSLTPPPSSLATAAPPPYPTDHRLRPLLQVKRGQVGGVWVAYHPVTASTAASRHIACVTLSVDGCDGSVAVAVSGTTAPPPPTHPPPPPSPRHRWNFSAWSLLRRKRIEPERGGGRDEERGGGGGEDRGRGRDSGGGAGGGERGSGGGGGGRWGGVGGGQGQPLMFNDVGLNQWVDAVCRVVNGSDSEKM